MAFNLSVAGVRPLGPPFAARAEPGKVERELRQSMAEAEVKAYAFVRAKGMKVHELAPNGVAAWRACSAGIIDEYMTTAGDIAAKVMAAYGELRTLPCCSSGPKGEFTLR